MVFLVAFVNSLSVLPAHWLIRHEMNSYVQSIFDRFWDIFIFTKKSFCGNSVTVNAINASPSSRSAQFCPECGCFVATGHIVSWRRKKKPQLPFTRPNVFFSLYCFGRCCLEPWEIWVRMQKASNSFVHCARATSVNSRWIVEWLVLERTYWCYVCARRSWSDMTAHGSPYSRMTRIGDRVISCGSRRIERNCVGAEPRISVWQSISNKLDTHSYTIRSYLE